MTKDQIQISTVMPINEICVEQWNRKVNATAMYSIPAEDEALPILLELQAMLKALLSKDLKEVISQKFTQFFFVQVFPPVCQKIIRSRYFKSTTVLKVSNQILQYCVYLFVKYLSVAEQHPKFAQLLTAVLCTDQYYFKTNNQLDYKPYPYEYFPNATNLINQPLEVGQFVDVLKFSSLHEKISWSQGKVTQVENDEVEIAYLFDVHERRILLKTNSPHLAPYQSKSKDFEWRMQLKIGDLVDCEDSFGGWYNGTVVQIEQREDGKKLAKITLKVYHEKGNKIDQDGRFFGFSDYNETLDVTSPKLQKYCSISKQRSYQSSKSSFDSIDDINDSQFEEINGQRIYALPRKRHLSDFMFKTINGFGRLGGFEKPLKLLQEKLNFELLCYYVKGISGIAPYLHKNLVKQLIQRIKPIIQRHIFDESQAVFKNFTKEKSEMLFSGLKVLKKRIFSMEQIYQYQNTQKMKLVKGCLQSEALKRKLQGLNQLKDVIKSVTHTSQRNKGIKNWILEEGIFEKIYIVNSHVQLIKKSQDFFRYLINESILEVTELQRLYRMAQKSDYQSRISLYKLFQQVSHIFKKPHVDFLIDTILESDVNLVLNQDIDLLHELCKYSSYFPLQKVMDFFEKIILATSTPKELNDYAIKKYSDIVAKTYQMKQYRQQIIKNFLNKLGTGDVIKVTKVLKGIFEGIGIGQWGKKDLNDILAQESVDNVAIQAIRNNKKDINWNRMVSEILQFLLFIYKLSYKVKIHISTLRVFWVELRQNEDKNHQFYKWANQVIKCEQGIQDQVRKGQFEQFFNQLFNEKNIALLTHNQFDFAKNFFVEINKKARNITVSTFYRQNRDSQKQYKRKVPMKNIKLQNFLIQAIYNVQDQYIANQALQFFITIYSSKDNTSQEINEFLAQLLLSIKKYHEEKQIHNIQKTLRLIQTVIYDSQKSIDLNIQSLQSKKKCQSVKFIIINQTSYSTDTAKKFDIVVPLNYTLTQLRQHLAKQLHLPWQQIRVVEKKELLDFFNSKTLKDLRLNSSDPLTISRRVVPINIEGDFFIDEQKKQMKPKALRVFKIIFDRYSTNGLMSRDQCNSFTAACLGALPTTKYYSDKITSVYAKYDEDHDGYLRFSDFINFYMESARERASTVWSNLRNFGVRQDFRFSDEPDEQIVQELLPRNSLAKNFQFYEILFSLLSVKKVASLAFSLLQKLPVSTQVQTQILTINQNQTNMNQFLSIKDPYLFFYKLNIIEYLVDSADSSNWLEKFIKLSGYEKLLNIVTQIIESNNLQDIERDIIATSSRLLNQYFIQSFGNDQVLDSIALVHSEIDLDDKIQYLVTGIFPKTQQKIQKGILKNKHKWLGDDKQNIIKLFIKLLKQVWVEKQTYLRDSLINHSLDILCILLVNQDPSFFTINIPTLLSEVPSLKITRKFYCIILAQCFYSENYQAQYIRELFKHLKAANITSEHFRVLAVLVTKYGTAEMGGEQMQQILVRNILDKSNELTVEGCARLLCNFTLSEFSFAKFEQIWQQCLFGVNACKKQQTRSGLYDLILKICDCNKKIVDDILTKVVQTLDQSASKIKITSCSQISQRSATGYCGLKNLGNICYINSFMQQLYHNPIFRYLLLRINDGKSCEMVQVKEKKVDDNFLHQVQRIFGYLQESTRIDFNPFGFCVAYKPFGQSVNTMQQQDVQQFISMFFDNLEAGIKHTPLKKLVDNFYAGKTTNLFKCHQCNQTKKIQQSFYSISLEVKNSKTLAESFNRFISGELISQYKCDFCSKKADVSKLTRISRPPKTLIIHLQRIVFNLDTFINQKISTKHQFPIDFNLYPYCLQAFEEKEKQPENKDEVKAPENHPNYDYTLVGIICHIGNAEAGHYISYIKCSSGKWIQFNDSLVSIFNISNLETECFGGSFSAYDDEFDWDKKQSSKSAYILLYQKKDENNIELVIDNMAQKQQILKGLSLQQILQGQKVKVKQEEQTESQDESSSMVEDSEKEKEQKKLREEEEIQMIKKQKSEDNIQVDLKKQEKAETKDIILRVKDQVGHFISPNIDQEIKNDNQIHFFERNIASPSFPKFFAQLLTKQHTKYQSVLGLLKKLAFGFWLKSPNFKLLLNSMGYFIKKHSGGIQEIVLQNDQVINLLIQSSDQDVRNNIMLFLSKSINDVIEENHLQLNSETELDIKIQKYLDFVFSLLPTSVSKSWTKFAQYFQFWYELAKNNRVSMNYMIRKEIIKHFLDYFLDKKSPLQIYANKAYTIGSKYANPNFSMLLKTVTFLIEQCLSRKQEKLIKKNDFILLLHFDCLDKLLTDNYETVCANIVKEICRNNLFASQKVAIVVMRGLTKSTFDNVQPYLDVIHEFLLIDDDYQELRIKWILGRQTLHLLTVSKTLVAMNSYSMDQRIYNFDSSLQVQQSSSLLQQIFQYHKKIENYAFLSLRELLKLCKLVPKIRNYVFALKSPTLIYSKYTDFFEDFINRYIEDAKRMYGYPSLGFNKEQVGKQVKELYEKVLMKIEQDQKAQQKKQKIKSKKNNSQKQSNEGKSSQNLSQTQKKQSQLEEKRYQKKAEKDNFIKPLGLEKRHSDSKTKNIVIEKQKEYSPIKKQHQVDDDNWSSSNQDRNKTRKRTFEHELIDQRFDIQGLSHQRTDDDFYDLGYSSEQQQPKKPVQNINSQVQTYHPVKFKFNQIGYEEKNGVYIYKHQSELISVLTKPTGTWNKSFVSSMGVTKTIEKLVDSAWENQKVEIVKGFLVNNPTRQHIRIKTSQGTLMVRPNQSIWVWADKIEDVFPCEKSIGWPKWTIYPIEQQE